MHICRLAQNKPTISCTEVLAPFCSVKYRLPQTALPSPTDARKYIQSLVWGISSWDLQTLQWFLKATHVQLSLVSHFEFENIPKPAMSEIILS